eukprot:g2810.t2
MRLHRVKLDPAMRSLGDTYARKEFRLHAKPQVQEAHKQMFLKEWRAYVDMVSSQATVTGQPLSEEQKSKLNDQQKVQLDSLEKSAKALGQQRWRPRTRKPRQRRPRSRKPRPRQRKGRSATGARRCEEEKLQAQRTGLAAWFSCTWLAYSKTEVREDGMFRHSEITGAHKDAVMSVVMAADCIYTASRDKTLKRWKVNVGASGKFELQPELEVPLGEVCWCLISAGDWLFCGLGDGNIKGFMKSGQQTVLSGHQKRVSCLMTHQHVLFRRFDATTSWDFGSEGTHGISEGISGSVTALAVLGEGLWVGGSSGLALVELATLKVVKQLNPRKFVAGLLQFEGHMIVVYADGSICIFDGLGGLKHQQPALPAGPVLCIAPRQRLGHRPRASLQEGGWEAWVHGVPCWVLCGSWGLVRVVLGPK